MIIYYHYSNRVKARELRGSAITKVEWGFLFGLPEGTGEMRIQKITRPQRDLALIRFSLDRSYHEIVIEKIP